MDFLEPILELRDLDITLSGQCVLRGINLQIPRGQTLAVIGESGCGKTVLLKALIGLIKPTRGQVCFEGRDLAQLSEKQLTRERIRFGYLFQHSALFDSMTVAQNVAFPLKQHRELDDHELAGAVMSRLGEVGLPEGVLAKRPAELSGGMRKRVGLARALVMNPDVLLYDEPTTGLDPIMSDVINELILRTRRRHTVTSVLVTHDMKTARKVADRVVMLYPLSRLGTHESQLVFDGAPLDIDMATDSRVTQFVRGEAGERLMEIETNHMAASEEADMHTSG
jgi:phospholipid/cholesterol/gamma-HCH transport system ATP-binding protein